MEADVSFISELILSEKKQVSDRTVAVSASLGMVSGRNRSRLGSNNTGSRQEPETQENKRFPKEGGGAGY